MAQADSRLLELVGSLHEGVIDDVMWNRGLDCLCDTLGFAVMMMGALRPGQAQGGLELFGHRTDQEALALLTGMLADPVSNPWLGVAHAYPLRRPATIAAIGGYETLKRSRIWEDFYIPYNMDDTVAAVLERQPESVDFIVAGRRTRQAGFTGSELALFEAVLPHLSRAWRVKRALTEMAALTGTLKFVLDRLDRAVVVAGPSGQIRFANRAADRLLSRGDGIDVTRGRIRATRTHHTNALLSLIDRAARTGIGDDAVAVDAVAIPCDGDNPALAVVAEPLAPLHSDMLGHSSSAGAILFISDSEACSTPPVQRLKVVYGLTAAEAQLTSLMVRGGDIASAARTLGVSGNTAKYHLKSVFGKVGVTRQAQLVRRILADVGGLAEPEKLRPS
jgi:DNA-binding CsgD family transcriptional regulator/PAS domain-containing protein